MLEFVNNQFGHLEMSLVMGLNDVITSLEWELSLP